MKKETITKYLHQVLNEHDKTLSFEHKTAIAEAIDLVETKGPIDPGWIVLLLQAVGVGTSILKDAP